MTTAYTTFPHPSDLPSHSSGFKPVGEIGHQVDNIAQKFLSDFATAAATGDGELFASLFVQNGYWRDIIAFTNDFRSIRTGNIAKAANARFPKVQARDFVFAETAPALEHPFEDVTWIIVHFTFSTRTGPAYGVARLVWEDDEWKAWTVFTLLEGVHGSPQHTGYNRPRGSHNDKVSYDERRDEVREFKDRDPEVLVIGGGHNGLATAAQLEAYGVETLVVDTYKRIGDNWRLRYRSLSLHDPVNANHLPFIPYPSTWPSFTPAGKLANFLEAYVEILELNVWTESTVDPKRTQWNESTGKWDVTIKRIVNGTETERKISVSHIVLATGLGGGKPKLPPPFKGQDSWDGTVVHSSKHSSGSDWRGKKALVVGACTSGHDISVDFAKNGVDVTMLQRTPTYVMSVDKGQEMLVGGLYNEVTAKNIDIADRIGESNPKLVVKLFHKRLIPKLAEQDKELLDGLKANNFKTWLGPEGSGFIMMALEKAGGYYYSTGGSEMIANGDIKVRQGEIASFEPGHVVKFKDGTQDTFDVVVFATGYTGFPDMVRATLGDHWAENFNPVWGLDEEGEIRGVARESGVPNTYFLVGALAGSRLMSKVLATQIVAQKQGLLSERYSYAKQKKDGDVVDFEKYVPQLNGKANGHGKANGKANGHPTPRLDAE